MHETDARITVIELARADASALVELRVALASAFLDSEPRILVDLGGLDHIDGPVLAALFIASKEIPAGGRFAVLASEPVMATIEEWCLDTFWECFTDGSLAEEFLLADSETRH
jgi:anti-anti-sigma regulatory factor